MSAAWMAGYFEGEGCIYKDPRCNSWRLTINNTDRDVLQKFARFAGVGEVKETTKKADHYKDMFVWHLHKRPEVRRVLEMMLPFFGMRRAYLAQNCIDAIDGV